MHPGAGYFVSQGSGRGQHPTKLGDTLILWPSLESACLFFPGISTHPDLHIRHLDRPQLHSPAVLVEQLTTTLVLLSGSVSMAREAPPRSWLSWVLPGFKTCAGLSRALRLHPCLVLLTVQPKPWPSPWPARRDRTLSAGGPEEGLRRGPDRLSCRSLNITPSLILGTTDDQDRRFTTQIESRVPHTMPRNMRKQY